MKSRLLGVAVVVCGLVAGASALGKSVTIRPNLSVGDEWETMVTREMVWLNVKNHSTKLIEARVKVRGVESGRPTRLEVAFAATCQEDKEPSPLAGKTMVLARVSPGQFDVEGKVEDEVRAEAKLVADYLFGDDLTQLLPRGAVSVGDSWVPELGQKAKGDSAGDAKVVQRKVTVDELPIVGGRQLAALTHTHEFSISEPRWETTMRFSVLVRMVVDVATGKVLLNQETHKLVTTLNGPDGEETNEDLTTVRVECHNFRFGATTGSTGGGGNPLDKDDAAFLGTFSDGSVTLEAVARGQRVSGYLTVRGQRYPIAASIDRGTLTGTFRAQGTDFDFTATQDGNNVTLKSGARTYNLKKQASTNPLE